jgi:hypothetical protein
MTQGGRAAGEWVLLCYRVPREPSTPRIAIWRKLRRLGVAQLGDGLVALPADARTREALEWVADEVLEAGGSATVWLGRPATASGQGQTAAGLAAARAVEYAAVTSQAEAGQDLPEPERVRLLRRLRGELRAIARRDFFPPPQRDSAELAVRNLAESLGAGTPEAVRR